MAHSMQLAGVSEKVIKIKGFVSDTGQWGLRNPYKPWNHDLYIRIIIFPHIDNTQSTGCHWLLKNQIKVFTTTEKDPNHQPICK